MEPCETITRRKLPHWYVPGAAHFATYRIAGTIPVDVLGALRHERELFLRKPTPKGTSSDRHRERAHKQFFARYDDYLDTHRDIAWLARPDVAAMVRQNLYHHHEQKYYLLAYCIMPNHVHALLQPIEPGTISDTETWRDDERPDAQSPLAKILHSLKSYTANQANRLLGRSGRFWQGESYDHWVRNGEELARIAEYIATNPVKANLVQEPKHWYFSSAHDRFLCDGEELGLLCYPDGSKP